MVFYDVSNHEDGLLIIIFDISCVHFVVHPDKRPYLNVPANKFTKSIDDGIQFMNHYTSTSLVVSQIEFDWYSFNFENTRDVKLEYCNESVWKVVDSFATHKSLDKACESVSMPYTCFNKKRIRKTDSNTTIKKTKLKIDKSFMFSRDFTCKRSLTF